MIENLQNNLGLPLVFLAYLNRTIKMGVEMLFFLIIKTGFFLIIHIVFASVIFREQSFLQSYARGSSQGLANCPEDPAVFEA